MPRLTPRPSHDFRYTNATKFNVGSDETGHLRSTQGFGEINLIKRFMINRCYLPLGGGEGPCRGRLCCRECA